MSGRPSGSSNTTGNGLPWGWNIGRAASGIVYGVAAKKGIEAAQRQGLGVDMDGAKTAATVSGLWLLWFCMVFIQGFWMFGALVRGIQCLAHTIGGHGLQWILLWAIFGIPAMIVSVFSLAVGRAVIRERESLARPDDDDLVAPTRRFGSVALWLGLFWIPGLLYTPLYATTGF
jgi:hypothetical protein